MSTWTTLATLLAHTLKGLAANIGANEVHEAAHQAEQVLKTDPSSNLEEILRGVSARLDPLLVSIGKLESVSPESSRPPLAAPDGAGVDYRTIWPLLAKLEMLLMRSSTGAIAVVARSLHCWPVPRGHRYCCKWPGTSRNTISMGRWSVGLIWPAR